MIRNNELCEIGTLQKPHGIKGEISATIEPDVDPSSLSCIVVDIDGIFVPFFIVSYRPKSVESILLTIDGVTNESEASEFNGKTLYALASDLPDRNDADGFYLSDLIGFSIFDVEGREIGQITDFDDSTENILLFVAPTSNQGEIMYIPAADEFFVGIDAEKKQVIMNLPEGL